MIKRTATNDVVFVVVVRRIIVSCYIDSGIVIDIDVDSCCDMFLYYLCLYLIRITLISDTNTVLQYTELKLFLCCDLMSGVFLKNK